MDATFPGDTFLSQAQCSLLVVDDDPQILALVNSMVGEEFEALTASSAAEAQVVLSARRIDVLLADQQMPGITGVQLLEWVRQHSPHTVALLTTGHAELDNAVSAINHGHVYHYVLKPWRTEELLQILRNAAERVILQRNRDQLLEDLGRLNLELEERVAERTRQLREVNHQLEERRRQLEEANALLQHRNRELEMLALTDSLTGLLNRRAIDDVARAELNRHLRYPTSKFALGIVDADDFREINRRHLLPGGDQALIGLARTLTASLRSVDTVGRIGGEEFLVVAPETGLDGAAALAERIRSAVVETPIYYNHERIGLTVSVGFAVADSEVTTTFDDMKHLASVCLNEAKAAGKNCSVVRPVLASEHSPVTSDQ
jgi:diguanylate cyclase (GGDEF)-like protein